MKNINKYIEKNIEKFTWKTSKNYYYTYVATYGDIELWFFDSSDWCGFGYLLKIIGVTEITIPLSNSEYNYFIKKKNLYYKKQEQEEFNNILYKLKMIFGRKGE